MGSPDQLRVRLLGGLEIEGLDQHAVGSRKARTLVKVLALGRGAAVSADTISEALWPHDDAPAKPQDQIGVLVSRLRATLGADRLPRSDAGWALTADWLDVVELEERVDEAAARLTAGSPGAARAAARAALTLVRGELLADELDAPWAEVDRARVARAIARARLVGAEAALAAGDALDAAVVAEGALDHDPYDEAALRVLMKAHTAAGRPASALAAYARLRERLAEDLGVDPVAETEELHTAILLGADTITAVPPPGRHRDARVVGRDSEVARLDAALTRADSGPAVVLVVEGEAGIGKTALVNSWLSTVSPAAVTFAGQCDELGRGLPLQPLLDALAAHLRQYPDVDVPPSLAPLLGPVAAVYATQPTTVADPALGQAQLFSDLLGTFERACGDRMCLLVVEDVHLATESTIEWLHHAARRGRRLLVIATRRPGDDRGDGLDRLSLGPLDLDAVAELVGSDRAPELFERSGGHPLFLVELAAAAPGELPESVREVVIARVEGLGPAAATLRAAAILGREVDVDLLAGVVGEAVSTLLEHLEAGVHARLMEESGSSLAFRHELVREALVAGTNAARRAFVHREAARVLSERPRRDPLQVAWHAQRGGDLDMASAALIDAAAVAAHRFDVRVGEELLDQAITLADSLDARLARARIRVARWNIGGAREDAQRALELESGARSLEVAAWVEYYSRDYDLAYRFGEEACARSDDAGLRASCLAMTGRVAHAKGDLADADLRLGEAVATAPPTVRGFAQAWLAGLRMHQGRPDETLDLIDRALAGGEWLGHPFVPHHGNLFRILALGQQGRVVEALHSCDRARDAAMRSGEGGSRFVSSIDNTRSWLLRGVGLIDQASGESLRIYESTSRDYGVSTAEMHHASMLDLVEAALLAGDLDATADAITRAAPVDAMHGTMAWHHRERYWVQRARFALVTGDPSSAYELATRAVEDARARGARRYHVLGHTVAARAAVALGEGIDHDEVDAALKVLDTCGVLEAWLTTAELAAATNNDRWWRDAERRAGALVATVGEHGESLRAWIVSCFATLGR